MNVPELYKPDSHARFQVIILLTAIIGYFALGTMIAMGDLGIDATKRVIFTIALSFTVYLACGEIFGDKISKNIRRYITNNVIGYWHVQSMNDGALVRRYELIGQHSIGNFGDYSLYEKVGGWGRSEVRRIARNNSVGIWMRWMPGRIRSFGVQCPFLLIGQSNNYGQRLLYGIQDALEALNSLGELDEDVFYRTSDLVASLDRARGHAREKAMSEIKDLKRDLEKTQEDLRIALKNTEVIRGHNEFHREITLRVISMLMDIRDSIESTSRLRKSVEGSRLAGRIREHMYDVLRDCPQLLEAAILQRKKTT